MKWMRFVQMLAIAVVLSVLSLNAWGSTFKVIYNFTGGQDGAFPVDAGNLAIDANGNLYGTTEFGGTCGQGTLFELSPSGGGWTETVVHSFCGGGSDGALPTGAPAVSGGFVYVDTPYGGGSGTGYLFTGCCLPAYGNPTSNPFSLDCTFGCNAYGGVTPDPVVQTLATAYDGGAFGAGTLYFSSTLVAWYFCSAPGCTDGSHPAAAVALDTQSNAYGTTSQGGTNGKGVVYECTADAAFGCSGLSVLHSFAGGASDGAYPFFATPLLAPSCSQFGCSNNLWGTTPVGGSASGLGYGTVWAINGFGTFGLVHSFDWIDGAFPYAGLTNLNGTFYGTTSGGGPFQRQCCPLRFKAGQGTIYSLTSGGTLTTLHTFTGPDGALPYSGLVADTNGNLYGVTFEGGANNAGVVYEITP
jgi:uncharacterized repeat protein (TIGR03803 family)